MTVRQEAIHMINSMPDETVSIPVALLKRMKIKDGFSVDGQAAKNTRTLPIKRRLGIADGVYSIPDDIDACNDEIARMFGVTE